MKKFVSATAILLLGFGTIGALPLNASAAETSVAPKLDLSAYLRGLNYNSAEILAHNGSKITNVPMTQ